MTNKLEDLLFESCVKPVIEKVTNEYEQIIKAKDEQIQTLQTKLQTLDTYCEEQIKRCQKDTYKIDGKEYLTDVSSEKELVLKYLLEKLRS